MLASVHAVLSSERAASAWVELKLCSWKRKETSPDRKHHSKQIVQSPLFKGRAGPCPGCAEVAREIRTGSLSLRKTPSGVGSFFPFGPPWFEIFLEHFTAHLGTALGLQGGHLWWFLNPLCSLPPPMWAQAQRLGLWATARTWPSCWLSGHAAHHFVNLQKTSRRTDSLVSGGFQILEFLQSLKAIVSVFNPP